MVGKHRPKRDVLTVDPAVFDRDGSFVASHSLQVDEYFKPEPQDSALGKALDALVDTLTPVEKTCVELRVFANLSYREIAEELNLTVGKPPYVDKKQAWRVTQRALRKLRKSVNNRPWLASIARNQHPFEEE